MTHDAFTQDPIHALEESLRLARAATHQRRLDMGVQSALQAIVQFGHAVVDHARVRDADLEKAKASLEIAHGLIAAIEKRIPPGRSAR